MQLLTDVVDKINDAITEEGYLSWRLGVSTLSVAYVGCMRRAWYSYRWVLQESYTRKTLDIFERGNVVEDRVIHNLTKAGVTVKNKKLDGKQFEATYYNGDIIGYSDGFVTNLPGTESEKYLLEVKSHNQTSYKAVIRKGVYVSKPEHYYQMQAYMHAFKFDKGLYLAVNKNTEDWSIEQVKYNKSDAVAMLKAGASIIDNKRPPKREFPENSFQCKLCPYIQVCHRGKPFKITCRSCEYVDKQKNGPGS